MNNSSGPGGCFAMIVCGILFILGPIVTLLYGFSSEEVYIRWSCLVWLVILTCLFAFIRDNASKFTLGALACLIYAIIFCSYYSEYELRGDYGDGGLGDLIGFFMFPFTMLVPMYFFGEMISAKLEQKKMEKIKMWTNVINSYIANKETAIQQVLSSLYSNQSKIKKVEKIVNLLDFCSSDKELLNYYRVYMEKQQKDLYDELKKINKIHCFEISMKSFFLSDIIKEYKYLKNKLQGQKISESELSVENYKEIKNRYKKFVKNN